MSRKYRLMHKLHAALACFLTLACCATAQTQDLQAELMAAAQKGELAKIEELMDAGADPHACSKYSESPFGRAARAGHTEAAHLMLDKGGVTQNPEKQNCPTPLMMAAMTDCTNLIARLLEAGADVNEKRIGGRTPLILAAQNGHNEAVRMLLDNGADMNVTVGLDNMTVVQWAIFTGKKDTVELLLDRGADPGPTPLMGPACQGNLEMMEVLVSRGADVNARRLAATSVRNNQEWEAALHAAATCCRTDSMAWLLEHGAPVDDPGAYGKTPLMSAITDRCHDGALLLIEKGANVNAVDRLNLTPLIYAARGGDPNVIQMLLKHGADVNFKGKSGMTALDAALEWEHDHIAVLLIKSGADVTADTLLRAAQERSAAWDNGELMQSILDRGVDVNSTSDLGETALMAAVQKGLTDNVQWLLSRGADATLKDNSGKTAEDYTKDPKILETLRPPRNNYFAE